MATDSWPTAWGPPARVGKHPDVSVILPGLLVGEFLTPADVPWLCETHGVNAVMSLQDDGDLAAKGLRLSELERAYGAHGVRFHRVPIADSDPAMLAARLDDALEILADELRAAARVYLHCNAGMNRAPTVAIAFVHVHLGLPLVEARAFVQARRYCVPYTSVLDARYGTQRRRTVAR